MNKKRNLSVSISRHAQGRMAQRGVSQDAIHATVKHGRRIRQKDGRVVYFMGQRELRKLSGAPRPSGIQHLAVVLHQRRGKVLTVMHVTDASWLKAYSPR